MSDAQHIPELLHLASDSRLLVAAQDIAAKKLLAYDGEKYPHDGCAITLSVLLQEAGIDIRDTYQAIALGNLLKNDRKWKVIGLGQQQTGDVGSTCGNVAQHGFDHIYLVLRVLNKDADEMVVADNQRMKPHFRWMSGKPDGKTPTRFFLRAPGNEVVDALMRRKQGRQPSKSRLSAMKRFKAELP